jgi:hypothetical protein
VTSTLELVVSRVFALLFQMSSSYVKHALVGIMLIALASAAHFLYVVHFTSPVAEVVDNPVSTILYGSLLIGFILSLWEFINHKFNEHVDARVAAWVAAQRAAAAQRSRENIDVIHPAPFVDLDTVKVQVQASLFAPGHTHDITEDEFNDLWLDAVMHMNKLNMIKLQMQAQNEDAQLSI